MLRHQLEQLLNIHVGESIFDSTSRTLDVVARRLLPMVAFGAGPSTKELDLK
jgi:hypothetical protein